MVLSAVESPWRSRRQRQPERHAKTEAVLQAAARLFYRRGFHGTSLDDIARSLGVSKPTLYYYVASKEQILFACVERGVAQLPPRSTYCAHMNLPLYSPTAPGSGANPG